MGLANANNSSVAKYGLALIALAAALFVRWLVDLSLGNSLPLVTLFGAVALSVWSGGYRPALVVMVAGYLGCSYLFMAPRGTIGLTSRDLIGLCAYLFTCSIIIALGCAARRAQLLNAEAAIAARQHAESLRITLESIGDAVITTDAEGVVTSINPVGENLTGWKLAEALRRPLSSIFNIVNELTGQPANNPVTTVIKHRQIVALANHTVLIAKDDTPRAIEDTAAPIIDGKGTLVGAILVFHDVSERRAAEKRRTESLTENLRLLELNRAIVTNMGEGLYTVNMQGLVTSVNPAAARMFGWKAEELLGRKMHDVTHYKHPDGTPFPIEDCAGFKVLHEGTVLLDYEDVFIRKDGSFFPVAYCSSPLRVNQETQGLVVVFRDTTVQKQAEAELRKSAATLAEADRRKDEFLAILAHELRNPLAPIRNATRILEAPSLSEEQLATTRAIIARQVRHMASLLDDLLDVSRITSGILLLKKQYIELQSVMAIAVETARPVIDAKHHDLVLDWPSIPIRMEADPIRLAQIASNLLTNAAKYSDPHSRITFGIRVDKTVVTVFVRDTGIGLSAEMLEKVFDMFTQVEGDTQRTDGGLGIGLALVKGLVELHGGRVQARSAGLNQGSEFLVFLPVTLLVKEATSSSPPSAPARSGRARRVLVADDNRDAADSLAMLLRVSGHEVSLAYTGTDTFNLVAAERPEVCILDVGMPGLSGYAVARRIRREAWGASLLLIAVTGWGQEHDRNEAVNAGFDHHFTKPVDPEKLEALIANRGEGS